METEFYDDSQCLTCALRWESVPKVFTALKALSRGGSRRCGTFQPDEKI